MADIVNPAKRSRMMAAIKSQNTNPERIVRSHLHRAGLRFRKHDASLPGRPDVVLRKWGAVVFVHGCFWHHHTGCRNATIPSSNRSFWNRKLHENVARDRRNAYALRRLGWSVYVIWECRISTRSLDALVQRIRR